MKVICIALTTLFLSAFGMAQITTDTSYTKQWNDRSNGWESFEKTVKYFNDDFLISELVQVYNGERWVNYSFKSISHNENGNLSEELSQFWNDHLLRWEDNSKVVYSYDEDGKLVRMSQMNIFGNEAENNKKEEYAYDAGGRVIEKTIFHFDNGWQNFIRNTYVYDEGNPIEERTYHWKNGQWGEPTSLEKFQYNKEDQMVARNKFRFENGMEQPLLRQKNYINRNGNLEELLIQRWDSKAGEWKSSDKFLFVNNKEGNVISSLHMTWNRSEWANLWFNEYSGNTKVDPCMPIEKEVTFEVRTHPFLNKAIVDFDNPNREVITIRILDEQGTVIRSCTTSGNKVTFKKDQLETGLYYVELHGDDLYTGKFSIE